MRSVVVQFISVLFYYKRGDVEGGDIRLIYDISRMALSLLATSICFLDYVQRSRDTMSDDSKD